MKLLPLLLFLGLSPLCTRGEVVRSNFDPSKLSGKWYSILLASDRKEKIEENGSMRVFVESIHPLDNSSLLFKLHTHENGKCKEISVVTDKTRDGIYTFEYDGHNELQIVETDYEKYIILHSKNSNDGETFQLMEFYGREPDVSPELKDKFVKISQQNGIAEENVVDLTNVDRCLQARDEK